MKQPTAFKSIIIIVFLCLLLISLQAQAEITNANLLDNVLDRYSAAASVWATIIMNYASWLFWLLVAISMVFTFGFMALRKAELGEFFAEFIRFTIFTGFFWWLLINGPYFATSIIASLRQIGGEATGFGPSLNPSGVVDIGFAIFFKVLDQSSIWSPVDSTAGILMGGIILVILALIGINMLLLLVIGWILAYSGIFFLGFGGSRWTSDIAITYYKTILAIAAQLMVMILLIGIGKTFLDDYYNRMSTGISLKEISVMLIVTVILLRLTNKIPELFTGMISGASVGGVGANHVSGSAAIGAVGMAVAAAATSGRMLQGAVENMAGGASALKAAFQKAQQNMDIGSLSGPGSSRSSSGNESHSKGLATAMGGTHHNPVQLLAATGRHLITGAGKVAQDKVRSAMHDFNDRIGETVGGKIASAIRDSGSAQADDDNSNADDNDEVAAFVNRKK
ncbi:MAG TPA: P-type conjugative transfer protein TrbL [Candidatus Competibacteraceae bacterium]|nr:P-type conjugative transfer protein TrbL [Candidatus Competibacteraceae bacterium]